MASLNGWDERRAVVGTACGWLMAVAVATAQPPQYTVVQLTVGNTTRSWAYDINASGQVVGSAEVDGSGTRPVLWANGALTDLGSLDGSFNAARGISPNTTIVGWSSYTSAFRAFVWKDGTISDAGGSTSLRAMAYAVNDNGTAVGDILSGPGSRTTAAMWQDGVRTVLPTYTPCNGCLRNDNARDINSSGQIVGQTETPYRRAALWQSGTVTDLGTLGGESSAAMGINDGGDVVGQAQLPFAAPTYGRTRAFVWRAGTMTSLGTLGDETGFSTANDINASGQVVGLYTKPAGAPADDPGRGFLWMNGVMYDLSTLVAGSGWTIIDAQAINAVGQIAVTGYREGDSRVGNSAIPARALLLNPAGFVPPPPSHTLYLAEGATSTFFDTQLALLNPTAITTSGTITYTLGDGQAIVREVVVPARSRRTINAKQVPGLAAAEFATRVDSHQRLVVDRTMTWDVDRLWVAQRKRRPGARHDVVPGRRRHASAASPCSTCCRIRPRRRPPCRCGTCARRARRCVKTYVAAATVADQHLGQRRGVPRAGQALAAAEFSAVIESLDGTPIIAERAMYRSNQGRTFNAGHESTGVTAPATDWFLAEGATGPFFDLFVLIANPTPTDAQVTVTYLHGGRHHLQPHADGPGQLALEHLGGRRDVLWRGGQAPGRCRRLDDGGVAQRRAARRRARDVVAGRQQHLARGPQLGGATRTGAKWAVASGEVGGARAHETYLLIANTSAYAGSATVTLMLEDGTSQVKTYALPALSRTNVAVGPDFGAAVTGRRFGAVIESTGDVPAQIVVERAMYSSSFAAGTNALATKLQ